MEKIPQTPTKSLLLLTFIAGLLAITNPGKAAYLEHLAWQIKDTTCKEKPLPLGAKAACLTLAPLPHTTAESILDGYSRRKNYLFFSVYSTDYWGLENQSVGIGRQFIDF